MLSEALQRNAKHEARLSNISGYFRLGTGQKRSEMESLASPLKLLGLRCSFGSVRMTVMRPFVRQVGFKPNEKNRINEAP
jgi:hypothetical protein